MATFIPDDGLARRWGNPSSVHWAGRAPKALLRQARQDLAELLGADPLEIVFQKAGE